MNYGHTLVEDHTNSPPIGANIRPTRKKSGRTVLGVRIGLLVLVTRIARDQKGASRTAMLSSAVVEKRYLYNEEESVNTALWSWL